MTKADKKDEVMKEQLETEALMDAEVEAATDCEIGRASCRERV